MKIFKKLDCGDKQIKVKKHKIKVYSSLPKGTVFLGYADMDNPRVLIQGENILWVEGFKYEITDEKSGSVLGFCKVSGECKDDGNEYFVGLKSKRSRKFILAVILAMIVALMGMFIVALSQEMTESDDDKSSSGIVIDDKYHYVGIDEEGLPSSDNYPNSQAQTIIDGIVYEGDYLEVTSNDYIPLGNNPENKDIYMVFSVVDDKGEHLFSSTKLYPGESIRWVPCNYLSNGIHKITIIIDVYHAESDVQDIGTNLVINLKVNK